MRKGIHEIVESKYDWIKPAEYRTKIQYWYVVMIILCCCTMHHK
jgi:hypothetical protein